MAARVGMVFVQYGGECYTRVAEDGEEFEQ
jgi:hypothetical protein